MSAAPSVGLNCRLQLAHVGPELFRKVLRITLAHGVCEPLRLTQKATETAGVSRAALRVMRALLFVPLKLSDEPIFPGSHVTPLSVAAPPLPDPSAAAAPFPSSNDQYPTGPELVS